MARRLGISRTTVSLVVSDHPRISARTKAKVWQCIEDLGYRPDPTARALATGRSNLIGFVVPDTSNLFFAEIFRGAEDASREKGYHILLTNGTYDLKTEERHVRDLLDLKIGGLIAGPAFVNARQALRLIWKDLRDQGFPVVLLNRHMDRQIFDQISPDNAQGVRLSTETLARLGHRRVAYISGIPEVLPVRQRLKAFENCAREFKFDWGRNLLESSPFTSKGGHEAAARLWRRLRRKPTAIMALNDTVATGVLKFLTERGVKVPDDVSLMGFDGTAHSEFSLIGISTVETPLYEMGGRAVEMIDVAMSGRADALQDVVLPVRLVLRESTARAKLAPSRRRTCSTKKTR